MEGFAEYESVKQHATRQCKLRLTVYYTKLIQNFQAHVSHGCNTFTILLSLFTGFFDKQLLEGYYK